VFAYVVRPNVWVLLTGVIPAAVANPTLNSVVIGYRTAVTPDALQGRVTSVARLLALAGAPLGPLVSGVLLDLTTARTTVALLGLWFVGLAVWGTLSPSIRQAPSLRELSEPAR
jgi:MFS family permease